MGYNLVASSFRQSFRLRATLNQWFMRALIGGVKLPPVKWPPHVNCGKMAGCISHTHAMTTHAMFAPYKSRVVSRGGLLLPLTYLPGTSVGKKITRPGPCSLLGPLSGEARIVVGETPGRESGTVVHTFVAAAGSCSSLCSSDGSTFRLFTAVGCSHVTV